MRKDKHFRYGKLIPAIMLSLNTLLILIIMVTDSPGIHPVLGIGALLANLAAAFSLAYRDVLMEASGEVAVEAYNDTFMFSDMSEARDWIKNYVRPGEPWTIRIKSGMDWKLYASNSRS